LSHFRVGWRNWGGSARNAGAGVTPRSDLLIVLLRRQRRVLLHCFRRILMRRRRWSRLLADRLILFTIGVGVQSAGNLASQVGNRRDGRHGVHGPLLCFYGGNARFGRFETGVGQPGNDPEQDAELDRHKIRNFQVHFATPPSAIINMTEPKANLFL
jgi:hypothetical protein